MDRESLAVDDTDFADLKSTFRDGELQRSSSELASSLRIEAHLPSHWLVGMGIVLGIVTGHNNVFTALEHCGVCGTDGLRWGHALGHIVLVPPLISLISWLPASAILFVTRKVRPSAFEGPLVVVLAKVVAFAAIAVSSLLLLLGIMRFS